MRCDEVEDRIEELAAGGQAPAADVSTHLRDCPRCSASLLRAREIDHALAVLPVPPAPASFTPAVMRRIRPVRWESEQRFDWWFNVVMAASAAAIVFGIWAALNLTGLAAVSANTIDFVRQSVPALYERAKPEISLYGMAAALVFASLAVWWWIERDGRPRRTV